MIDQFFAVGIELSDSKLVLCQVAWFPGRIDIMTQLSDSSMNSGFAIILLKGSTTPLAPACIIPFLTLSAIIPETILNN